MLLSARLALSGQDVTLWTRTEEQARRIDEQGVALEVPESVELERSVEQESSVASLESVEFERPVESAGGTGRRFARLRAAPFADARQGEASCVLVAVKQTALNEALLGRMSHVAAQGAVFVLFQNGIGHFERMQAALPGRRLLSAVTTEGALRTGLASVRHTGRGETWIGSEAAHLNDPQLEAAMRAAKLMMEKAGFSAFLSNEIRQRILRKLLINAVINPLTAIWRISNGELPNSPDRLIAMQALFRETSHLLRLHGGLQGMSDAKLWEALLEVCAATSANRSSMLQDVLAGRQTEIDAVNGQICRMAAEAGEPSPWNEIVTTLVKAIQ